MAKEKSKNTSSVKTSSGVTKDSKKTPGKNPKSPADKRARKIAMDRKSELTIHGRDGRIQDKSSLH